MPANTDKFQYVGVPGTATTLASPGYTAGVSTSINVGSTSNWPTASGVSFAIDQVTLENGVEVRVPGTYTEFTGVVTGGTTVSSLDLNFGTDQNYPAGSTTRVYIPVSSTRENALVDGLLEEHNQDGSHSAVTATSVSTDTVTEKTAAAGVTIDGLSIKDGKLNTNDSVVTSNITDASVTFAKTSGIWWEELGRATATTNTTTLTIPTIANKKYLKIIFSIIPTAAMASAAIVFNNDTTGSNYGFRSSTNGGADATGVSNGIPVDTGASPGTPAVMYGSIEGVNISTFEKAFLGHSLDTFAAGSGNQPRRREIQGKWANSAVISRVDLIMSVNAAAGSEIIVIGHN